MAGMIAVAPGKHWSAAGWLFDWVVEFLIKEIDNADTKRNLQEIIDNNLGWLAFDDFAPSIRKEMLYKTAFGLVPFSRANFPERMTDRERPLIVLTELAGLAEAALRSQHNGDAYRAD